MTRDADVRVHVHVCVFVGTCVYPAVAFQHAACTRGSPLFVLQSKEIACTLFILTTMWTQRVEGFGRVPYITPRHS